jgi:hypothetical protein
VKQIRETYELYALHENQMLQTEYLVLQNERLFLLLKREVVEPLIQNQHKLIKL